MPSNNRRTRPLHPMHEGCNPDCHRLAIERYRIDAEIRLRLRLDGDDETIALVVQILEDSKRDAAS